MGRAGRRRLTPMDLDQLVLRWRAPIAGYCAARGLDAEAADAVAQDVFVDVWQAQQRFRGDWDDPGAVGAWLRGFTRTALRAAFRARFRRRFEFLDAEAASPGGEAGNPEASVALDEEAVAVRAAVRRLPPGQREVVWMFYIDEASTRDVAGLLGISEKAVENRLRKGRARLRELLAARLGEMQVPGDGPDRATMAEAVERGEVER